MKNPMIWIAALWVLLAVSCESRKDPFHSQNLPPRVVLSATGRDFSDSLSVLDVRLRHGEEKTVYFDFTDDYLGENPAISYSMLTLQGEQDYVQCQFFPEARKLLLQDLLPPETMLDKIVNLEIRVRVSDYYGDYGEAVIRLISCDNQPPEPKITLSCLQGMEYLVSVEGSTDPDGDKIACYEYLFDGFSLTNRPGYENPNDPQDCNNPGMAAEQGTYIIATPLQEVKHAFQEAGIHKIEVRARDALGMWSSWTSYRLTI